LALVLGVFLTLGATAQWLNLAWGLWFSEAFIFLAIPVIALQTTGRSALRLSGLDQPATGVALGLAVGLANYAAWAVPLMWLSEHLFPKEMVERYSSARLLEKQQGFELVLLIAGVSLAAPLCEEFLFRGLLQQGLARRLSMPRSLVVTAFIFSAMHFDPVGLLARFELGVVFGLLAWRAGSLWPAIGAHAANNLISAVVFVILGGDDAEVPWTVVALLWVVGNALLAGIVMVSRRSHSWWRAPVPSMETSTERHSLVHAASPWVLAAVLSFFVLVLADHRGVALNVIDRLYPAQAPAKNAPESEQAAWSGLQRLRQKARQGELPLAEYQALRRLASRAPSGL
jgi:membrane protease YdiL (CAAX protease family)